MTSDSRLNLPAEENRVLVLPPTSRDADAIRKLLADEGIACAIFTTMAALCDALAHRAGAVVVSEEAVIADSAGLASCVRAQPVWSDLPIIVLSRSGVEMPPLTAALGVLGNVSVLERPVRVSTLISIVRSALRARDRQYQVRAYLLDQKKVEEQRLALLEAERTARGDAERAGKMKDEFLATLSHELRTPLNAILGWTLILKASPSNAEDVAEGINVIERNARAQTQIIEDLLDMSRIISGKIRLDIQRVDIATVVRAAVETVKPAADVKDIRVFSVLDSTAAPIAGDPNRLQQVFWNLLTNAVKFTPRGGRVQVLLERMNSNLQVSVIDTGEGIDPRFLPHVFDRFRQADATTTRRHGGLGLGLAIVKQLVELHGGSICAKSPGKGAGASFIVTLPLSAVQFDREDKPEHHHIASAPVSVSRDASAQIAGLRILVVDDEPDARTLLQRLLEDYHATVFVAGSADEAVMFVESKRPDVIVSDIGMPGEDGYAFIRRVRALPPDHGGNTSAVALTAYARAEDRVQAILAGFQHHISKPVEPAELIAMIASLANRIPMT